MPGFRKARGELLLAYDDNLTSEEEFLLLTRLKTLIMINWIMIYRYSHRRCSMKKDVVKFPKISQNSQENACARVFF